MAENGQKAETIVSDLHKKIESAFEAFDYENNNTVDVREIGTIIYSLGCFPSQADLHDFISKVEDDHSGYIHKDKFVPAMAEVLLENKFPPIAEDVLLQAFEVLDSEHKGYLDTEELTQHMIHEGEHFTQEEVDEMLAAHANSTNNLIYYKELINQLTIDPNL